MRILITGGAGFIGSNLAEHLLAKGHAVTAFDNLSSGKKENLPPGAVLIKGDVRDTNAVANAMAGQDAVVHLAAEVFVAKTIEDPALAEQVNVLGTINVLQAARQAGVKKAVLASSAAIYGDEPTVPTTESERPRPMSPYAITKLAMEDYAVFYASNGLPTCCLRFFNVYGPKQDPKSQYSAAIPAFITRSLEGEPLTVYGDGLQTRDFISVGDVCRAVELALTKGSGTCNVATGKSVTVKALAGMIVRLTGSKSAIVHAPARAGDPRTSLADVTKAKKQLGFVAATSLEEGLKKTVASYKKR